MGERRNRRSIIGSRPSDPILFPERGPPLRPAYNAPVTARIRYRRLTGPARPRDPRTLHRRMHWLLGLTFLHVFGEGGLALFEAVRSGSLALLAFGLESVIEGGAAFLAVRHLRHLADEEEDHARRDQMLARWIGVSFLLLASYTLARGVFEIARGNGASSRARSDCC